MVNILLNSFRFAEPWCQREIGRYLRPEMRVLVFPFAFRPEQIPDAQEWETRYNRETGMFSMGLAQVFRQYDIPLSQLEWVNYYAPGTDLPRKIEESDVLYFCGGEPDLLYDRLAELGLLAPLKRFRGIVMGDSAGAVIQFDRYHDQPGLGYLRDFDLEVHYTGSGEQQAAIRQVLAEHGRPVFALGPRAAMIVENQNVYPLGDVVCMLPSGERSK